jgi:hypothetical protein
MENQVAKPHHLSKEGRELKAKEEDAKKLAEQGDQSGTENQGLASKIEVVDEIVEKPAEIVEEKEPSIPLSQVSDLVAQEVAKAMANLPIQQPIVEQKEVQKEIYKPLSTKDENFDDIPGLEDFEVKDRIYVLCNGEKPPSRGIRNRSKAPLSPLTYLNPKTNQTYALRYSVNQVSFFMEKQKGDVVVTPIEVKYGMLKTNKNEIPLQKFLAIHPDNKANGGSIFEEYDPGKEASLEIEKEDRLYEAQSLVRSISPIKQDAVARLMCSDYKEEWVPAELKRSLYSAVAKSPAKFLQLANQPTLEIKGVAKTALYRGVISYSNYKWLNENKEVLVEVSRNQDEYDAIAEYLMSGKGMAFYEYLKQAIG